MSEYNEKSVEGRKKEGEREGAKAQPPTPKGYGEPRRHKVLWKRNCRMNDKNKLESLRKILRGTKGLAVAFSGGLDSTFLLAVAKEELGKKVIAVTALSPTYPSREQKEAVKLAAKLGVKQVLVESNELKIPHFADNPVNRCYFCKQELFKIVRDVARRHGIREIADGCNADDLSDYRPGRKAAKELKVLSPLLEAGLCKNDIRKFSKQMGLPTANKPSFACLASRFPYGSRITDTKLKAVDSVELLLMKLGFRQVRVRHHGEVARIEVEPAEIQRLAGEKIRRQIVLCARKAGFKYVALDLEGYRTGSLNRGLAGG